MSAHLPCGLILPCLAGCFLYLLCCKHTMCTADGVWDAQLPAASPTAGGTLTMSLLMCRASMVPGLTSTNATLTAENSRLNDRMAKLVQDLTEENKHLLDENQHLNQTVQKVHHSSVCLLVCKQSMQHTLSGYKASAPLAPRAMLRHILICLWARSQHGSANLDCAAGAEREC